MSTKDEIAKMIEEEFKKQFKEESTKIIADIFKAREEPASVFLAKVISGGRITIPEEIRMAFGIEENSIIQLRYIHTVKTEPK